MTVTIKRVATEAGVSVATVSRILNGTGRAAEATRARVLAVAERLRYSPHGAARSLRTWKTNTIGVLLPDLYGEFFSEVIRGIDGASRAAGYHLLVSGSHAERSEIEAVLRATRGRVDGLIVMSPDIDTETLRANLPESLPIVLLNCRVDGAAFDSIEIDNYGGAFAMVRHLVEAGHRRVAIITGPPNNYDAQERLRGYRDALREPPGEWSERLEIRGDFSEEAGFRGVRRVLALEPRPTAIFAANDSMAVGALSALHEAGLRVPEDVALAGFDDIPIARFVSPPLTSVHVPIDELGRRAIEQLVAAIEMKNRHRRRHATVATTVVVRRSSGASTNGHLGTSPTSARNRHPVRDSGASERDAATGGRLRTARASGKTTSGTAVIPRGKARGRA